jgi:hypothetical protein
MIPDDSAPMILVDTNIPLRIAQVGHPHRQVALDALEQLTLRDNERFAIAPQSLYEMYVVCTRPAAANGGFGMTAVQAGGEIAAARALFELLPETAQVYPHLGRSGRQVCNPGQTRPRCSPGRPDDPAPRAQTINLQRRRLPLHHRDSIPQPLRRNGHSKGVMMRIGTRRTCRDVDGYRRMSAQKEAHTKRPRPRLQS